MKDSVYTLKDYGKATIQLKQIIDMKKISRNKLCNMIATNYDLVNRYYNNKVVRIDLDIIARMCYVLDCDINDLIKYEK
ncbi:MAG: helix-turn-helix transcriptional regulator [Clostridium sp.]|nr:helix-turn-helix transcriptional regulator [Clostridium sp.]